MKKILLISLIFFGLYAQGGMNSGDNFISVQAGLGDLNSIRGLESGRLVISYGMNLESGMSYIGFAEIGVKAPLALLTLKYGYEFMKEEAFSFGLDIAILFGMPGRSSLRSSMNLALGNEAAVFAMLEATDSISAFIRGGVSHETSIQYLSNFISKLSPFVEIGMRYHL